jgi:hypothetical protein
VGLSDTEKADQNQNEIEKEGSSHKNGGGWGGTLEDTPSDGVENWGGTGVENSQIGVEEPTESVWAAFKPGRMVKFISSIDEHKNRIRQIKAVHEDWFECENNHLPGSLREVLKGYWVLI